MNCYELYGITHGFLFLYFIIFYVQVGQCVRERGRLREIERDSERKKERERKPLPD